MTFQIQALSESSFEPLFELSDAELAALDARRETVTSKPGFPCRISLEDAEIGEEVLLIHFEHQPEATPYRAGHAIYVRKGVRQAKPDTSSIPSLFRSRLMSVRAFDSGHSMVDADVVPGTDLELAIIRMLEDPAVSYLHLHNAKPGCYAAKVVRS